ncbi:hypothetical protein ACH5RR_012526 [Cinchona calisaya]|uniref:Polyprotein n=1 Tax=Cinchona calisaya TaxID=153742 RepID=A0ABD3A7W7_9GENT
MNFKSFKTCHTFWKKLLSVFANDIPRLYDPAQKLSTLKQPDHDMPTFITKAQVTVEELKMNLQVDSFPSIMTKLDNLSMVLVLRGMCPDFEHVHDQILTVKTFEASTMVLNSVHHCQREGQGIHEGQGKHSSRPLHSYCKKPGHTQETCYSLHGFLEKRAHVSQYGSVANISQMDSPEVISSKEDYHEYLSWKVAKQAQSSHAIRTHNYNSIACISHFDNYQNTLIIDLGASNHIVGNSSLSTSLSFPKIFISLH